MHVIECRSNKKRKSYVTHDKINDAKSIDSAKKFGTVADAVCYVASNFGVELGYQEHPRFRVVEVPNTDPPPRVY